MVTLEELDRLVALMRETGVVSLAYEDGHGSVRLEFAAAEEAPPAAAAGTAAAAAETEPAVILVTSRGLGEFLDRHPTEDRPLAAPGTRVVPGQVVGYLKVGPTLAPIVSEVAGRVRGPLVDNGSRIGFGTPVLELVEGQ